MLFILLLFNFMSVYDFAYSHDTGAQRLSTLYMRLNVLRFVLTTLFYLTVTVLDGSLPLPLTQKYAQLHYGKRETTTSLVECYSDSVAVFHSMR